MSETDKPVSFADRMTAAGAAIGKLRKDGHNAFHNYDYVTEAAVKAAVGPALRDAGLYIADVSHTLVREVPGSDFTKVLVMTHLTVSDGTTHASSTALGSGSDKGDKAGYKAMAGGLKYALTSLFLIPTGDDAEADEATDRAAAGKAQAKMALVEPSPAEDAGESAMRIIGQLTDLAQVKDATAMLSRLKPSMDDATFGKVKAAFQEKRSALEAAKKGS